MKKTRAKNILLNYENKWVATNNNKVLAAGKTIKETYNKLMKLKVKDYTLTFVLPFDTTYSPYVH